MGITFVAILVEILELCLDNVHGTGEEVEFLPTAR
jgi:hypothetical protein